MIDVLKFVFVLLPLKLVDAAASLRGVWEMLALACILLLGVHGATDVFDDAVFGGIDIADRWVDGAFLGLCAWLADRELIEVATAVRWGDAFSLFLDIDGKESATLVLALVAELIFDVAILLWCLPAIRPVPAVPSSSPLPTNMVQRLRAGSFLLYQRLPGALRAIVVVFAFAMGAFTVGRFVSGELVLVLSPLLSTSLLELLAPCVGILVAGLAAFTIMPLAAQRAQARAEAYSAKRPLRALLLPLLLLLPLIRAITTGAPAQALFKLAGSAT